MKWYCWHVVCVTLIKSEKALFSLVIPHFNMAIIASWNQMWSVKTLTKINAINSCLMSNQRIIGIGLLIGDCPDLNCSVQRCTSEHWWVFWVYCDLHDVMIMVFISINLLPSLIPIEQFDGLIIRATEQVGQLWVHSQVPDEIIVLIYHFQLFTSVIVVYSNFSVVCTHYYPLLTSHEFCASHGAICHFEWSHLRLLVVIEDSNIACI